MKNKLLLEILLPCSVFKSEKFNMVVISGFKGYFGVLKYHSPLITTIKQGSINIYQEKKLENFFVIGGIVKITELKCTILTDKIFFLHELNEERAYSDMQKAERDLLKSKTFLDSMNARHSISIAQAQLRTIRYHNKTNNR